MPFQVLELRSKNVNGPAGPEFLARRSITPAAHPSILLLKLHFKRAPG